MKDILSASMAIQSNQAGRVAHACLDTARLAATAPGPQTWSEAAELATATFERIGTLQKTWADQWTAWLGYAGTLAGANTTPKFLERTGNIVLQAQAQVLAQAVDLTDLAENISVSYSFWVRQQLEKRQP